jgi:hypothetical protein
MSNSPLTPVERSQRARIAAHARWAKETDRLAATAPCRRAAFEKLLDEVDPERKLPEPGRFKRARNLQQAQPSSSSTWRLDGSLPSWRIDQRTAASTLGSESMTSASRMPLSLGHEQWLIA